jgi:hypothetical protein
MLVGMGHVMSIFPFSKRYNIATGAAPNSVPSPEDVNTQPNWILVMGFISTLLVLAIASDLFLVWVIGAL